MRRKRHFPVGGVVLMLLALCALLAAPVRAATLTARSAGHFNDKASAVTSINVNVFLANAMLQPLFQNSINQQIPQAVNNTLASIVSKLPVQDQGWAGQMASVLLQPSATLVSLAPQPEGLLTKLKLSLYPGDPRPITASLLIGFGVADASTIQVTALPDSGGQSLIAGPLTTFHVSIGSLNTITATPNCGDADLNVNLKFPVALGTQGQVSTSTIPATTALSYHVSEVTPPAANSYIEIPSSSLAQLGGSIGVIPVSSSLTAQNIRVGVQGSNLTLTSDISWHGIGIGTAVSTLSPGTSNGNLVVHVLNTNLQILGGLITFPLNNYNQQIEQIMNSKLNGALAGKFSVAQAAIGSNPHLPCVPSTSLVLAGTIALS